RGFHVTGVQTCALPILLLFLASHAVASNVIPLELAFEHRNHFGLAGIVLAVGSLLAGLGHRLRLPPLAGGAVAAVVLAALAGAKIGRAACRERGRSPVG